MMHRPTARRALRIAAGALHGTYVIWGIALALRTMQSGSPVTPELYGPLVWLIPAFVWFAAQIGAGSIALIGALVPGRWGLALMALGSALIAVVFGFFAHAASGASMGIIVATGAMFHAVPLSVACLVACVALWGRDNDERA